MILQRALPPAEHHQINLYSAMNFTAEQVDDAWRLSGSGPRHGAREAECATDMHLA